MPQLVQQRVLYSNRCRSTFDPLVSVPSSRNKRVSSARLLCFVLRWKDGMFGAFSENILHGKIPKGVRSILIGCTSQGFSPQQLFAAGGHLPSFLLPLSRFLICTTGNFIGHELAHRLFPLRHDCQVAYTALTKKLIFITSRLHLDGC